MSQGGENYGVLTRTCVLAHHPQPSPAENVAQPEQGLWYLFDAGLALPEFVVEFAVVPPPSSVVVLPAMVAPAMARDPKLARRKPAPVLGGAVLLELANAMSFDAITVVELPGCEVASVKGVGGLSALKRLVLPCNKLEHLGELGNLPALEHLDVSFNSLATLQDLPNLPALTHCNLRGNRLSELDDIQRLATQCRTVAVLDLRTNLFPTVGFVFRSV